MTKATAKTTIRPSAKSKHLQSSHKTKGEDSLTESKFMFRMILSPAKTLDMSPLSAQDAESILGDHALTQPDCDVERTQQIFSIMKKQSPSSLGKLLGISPALSQTAHEYWSNFDATNRIPNSAKPALLAFSGAAYLGLQAKTLNPRCIAYLQKHLRIVDPFYGSLRPLDAMQPYRLEMATKSLVPLLKKKTPPSHEFKSLAQYWSPSMTKSLMEKSDNNEMDAKIVLVNLASDEYSAAVDETAFDHVVKIVFQQEGRVIAVHAKRARGLFCRFMAENEVASLKELEEFNREGYQYVSTRSTPPSRLVFDRPKPQPASKKQTSSSATQIKSVAASKRAKRTVKK
eukprot:CAMPEP_0198285538 /NCGR_PEP_ID=MMETSP1449-20131203/4797_1 /TAXON_ID=420275 /ORGANISM="Attheya septentrionalis, Strain CCMP2084" /LENGTH=343 /DNA_ID=CAMNT_0043982981 /DNA_START=208 /DNA_END=1239 /DNA_ORIENTATION=-